MKKEFIIKLNMIEDLKNFVHEMTYNIKSDVFATYERQVINAKSLLGMISICVTPMVVEIFSDDEEEIKLFNEICERYVWEK